MTRDEIHGRARDAKSRAWQAARARIDGRRIQR
jgi:hypothetical protein